MLWKSSVEFASADVRALIFRAVDDLAKAVGEPVYVSDEEVPSLVTQSEIRRRVERVLAEATETLDTADLASQLRTSRSNIETVLSEAVASTNSFSDGVHILPQQRIKAIGNKVLSQGEICSLSDICHEEHITLKAATYAVKEKTPELLIFPQDGLVVPQSLLDKHISEFKLALESAREPTKYSNIENNAVLLRLIKQQLGIASHDTEYVPESFVAARQEQAEKLLMSLGYVAISEIASIEDPQKLAKRTHSFVIDKYVVTREYLETEHKRVLTSLSSKGFADLKECELYPQLSKFIVEDFDTNLLKFRSQKNPPSYLVKPSLERDLVSKANTVLKSQVEIQVSQSEIDVDGSTTLEDLVAKVKLPETKDIQTHAENMGIPTELRLAERVLPQVRKAYKDFAANCLLPVYEEAIEKLEAKVFCYLNAVLPLPASELRTMAWEEWQQYVSDLQFPVPANPDAAKQRFNLKSSVVESTAQDLQSKALLRLKKLKSRTKDAPLLLHLAATIYHSQHFAESPGAFFKIRGKAVPKLIKQFDFPPCFDNLRKQISNPPEELMNEVRESVSR